VIGRTSLRLLRLGLRDRGLNRLKGLIAALLQLCYLGFQLAKPGASR
jgi:hypothetical protein